MGNWKAIVPIMLSLLIAAAGSLFVNKWVQSNTVSEETVKVRSDAVPVMVAKEDIPQGSKIREDSVSVVPFLEESLPPGYHTRFDEVEGRVVVDSIKKGEPVVERRLAPEGVKNGGISAVLQRGKRAVAVKGDKVVGISGFVEPGDKVDVLATIKDPESGRKKTKIVLQNISVIASGTKIEENEANEPAPYDVYTLEVTPEESEKLALATEEGKIQFALRNWTDEDRFASTGTTIHDTFGGGSTVSASPGNPAENSATARMVPAEPARPVSAKKAPSAKIRKKYEPKPTMSVEIIRGSEMSVENFNM